MSRDFARIRARFNGPEPGSSPHSRMPRRRPSSNPLAPHASRWRKLLAVFLGLSLLASACGSGAGKPLSERQLKAQAMFAERCKGAGEKIYKTVDDVEGVYLLKVRPTARNYGDQFRLDDPYGKDLGGLGYIETSRHSFAAAMGRATPATRF